jgi:hypothetical protein
MEQRHFGVWASLFDSDGDFAGYAHVPAPLEPGDVVALETGRPLRVVDVVPLTADDTVQALAMVEPE